ncbi:low temperature requirement protein A [Micromonospora sp. NPDC049523]|uniref:low temperature requirement protein A n=1 Tax=Micromonospora sp. NPDC049523 TaxID=3155921 RepID=UPI003425134B
MTAAELPRILRSRQEPLYPTFLELFFDLVYIFMLARLADSLTDDVSVRGTAETAVLLFAAWWVWVLTAWLTDVFNPRRPRIQAVVIVAMFGTLVMAVAAPRAFELYPAAFVAAYYGIHVAREAVLIPGSRSNREIQARSVRVSFWFLISAPLWVGGVFIGNTARLVLWAIAVVVDFGSARMGWPTPRFGRTRMGTGPIFAASHLTERHRQILIVALGELVLTIGLGLVGSDFTANRLASCAVAFAIAVLLFQLYFYQNQRLVTHGRVVERLKPGTSTSYTYLVMVAGVVVTSASASLVMRRPTGDTPLAWAIAILGGPALFLLGTCLFDHLMAGRIAWTHVVAILALIALAPTTPLLPPLGIMIAASLVLLIALVVELTLVRPQPAPAAQHG